MKTDSLPSRELSEIRRKLAEALIRYSNTDAAGQAGLSLQEMASMTGTSKENVNVILKSLHNEGSVTIDRHRLAINKNALQEVLDDTES